MRRLLMAALALLVAQPAFASGNGAWFGGLSPGFKRVAAGAAPDIFVEDTFTDTAGDLLKTQHTGETGATWTANGASSTANGTISDANRLYGTTNGTLYPSGTPADDNYYIEADFYTRSLQSVANSYWIGVHHSTSALSGYNFGFVLDGAVAGRGNWRLDRRDTGTATTLITGDLETLTVSTHYIARLSVSGNVLTFTVNGSPILVSTVPTSTYDYGGDATKYTTGPPAIRMQGVLTNTTGIHFDYVKADNTP